MFLRSKIISKSYLTSHSVQIDLEIPASLPADFLPGQYLVIRIPQLDHTAHRSYSLCAAPYEKRWSIGIKKVDDGKVSSYLCDKALEGEIIEVMAPQGSFHLDQNATLIKKIVAFASGSGITPIFSIIKDRLRNSTSRIQLFYGNKNREQTMFYNELKKLEMEYSSRFDINFVFSQEKVGLADLEGRINKEKMVKWKEYLFDSHTTDAFLLCGPGNMVHNLEETLLSYDVPKSKIYTELFSTPVNEAPKITMEAKAATYLLEYKVNNKWTKIEMQTNQDVLLDIGMKHGLDLPYSCKSGVCSTCQAKLVEGSVTMDNNYVLSDGELKQGYILTCQSHATASHLKIDYDMK